MAGIGIAKKGLGLLGKKRKTLTISTPTSKPKLPPRKGEVVVMTKEDFYEIIEMLIKCEILKTK